MEGKGLGRGLDSIAHLAEDGPDLSGYVSTEVDELLSSNDSPRIAAIWMIIGSISFGTMNALVKFSSGPGPRNRLRRLVLAPRTCPLFFFILPEWSILFGGFTAGTIAFFVGELNDK